MRTEEHCYTYAGSSRLDGGGLMLATSGGVTERGSQDHPRFYSGFLGHPRQSAQALLVIGLVARTRFHTPPGMVARLIREADPVVTSNVDRLRFESFSVDGGVYARLDLLPGTLDGPALLSGTTNVDLNPATREALTSVRDVDPLHLAVGAEELRLTTATRTAVERKVPLPERWLRGFAEVGVAASAMAPRVELSGAEARRFLQALPRTPARGEVWAVPAGRGLRLSPRHVPGALCLPGPQRLRVLEAAAVHATRLVGYGPPVNPLGPVPGASGWELGLDDARLTVVLSPATNRGFSGEGGVLGGLAGLAGPADGADADADADADAGADADADVIAEQLTWSPRLDPAVLAGAAGLPLDRVLAALAQLGAAGKVGYDLADAGFFHRVLPYDPALLEGMNPRLRSARALLAAGRVQAVPAAASFLVAGPPAHTVRLDRSPPMCTCPWWGRHRGLRGPCAHVLAAQLFAAAR